MSLTYSLLRTEMLPLGFATNVINSTLSVLTPGIRILYFCSFLPLKMTRRRVETFEI